MSDEATYSNSNTESNNFISTNDIPGYGQSQYPIKQVAPQPGDPIKSSQSFNDNPYVITAPPLPAENIYPPPYEYPVKPNNTMGNASEPYKYREPVKKKGGSNRILIVSIIIFIVVLIIVALVLWWVTGRDVARYEKLIEDIDKDPARSTGQKGPKGTDGKSAYEIFLEKNPDSDLTEEQFEAKYVADDGTDGPDAPPADNGSRGSDGTTGDVGDPGDKGATGDSGDAGQQGPEGEVTIVLTFDDTAPSPGYTVPTGALSYEIVDLTTTPTAPTLELFVDGASLTKFTASHAGSGPAKTFAFISFIVYDDNFRIVGFTSPLTLANYDIGTSMAPTPADIAVSWTPALPASYTVRANLSMNKGNVLSSFTNNVIEKNLKDESFVYKRPLEKDPFAKKFYDIIAMTSGLQVNEFEFDDKIVISAASSTNFTINIRDS